jgi:nucleoid DNA-binding protein
MTKAELVDAIANESNLTKSQIDMALTALCNVTTKELTAGNEVSLLGIGKLKPSVRAARTGRNPRTGEAVDIAETTVVKFSVAKALKEAIA